MAARFDVDKCWAKTGVWAREGATCPTLDAVGHCRNCQVYSQAGREYLNHSAIIDTSESLALAKTIAAPRTVRLQAGKLAIVFRLGAEWLALETKFINQVVNEKPVRWIPHRSGRLISGIASYRGNAVVVFSIRNLLGIDEATNFVRHDKRQVFPRVLLCGNDQSLIMFPVDDVYGRHQYSANSVRPVPDTLSKAMVTYSQGLLEMHDFQVGILDGDLLMYGVEQELR